MEFDRQAFVFPVVPTSWLQAHLKGHPEIQASTSPERSFKIKCFLSNRDPATTRPFHWRLDKYPFGQVRWTFPHCHPKEIH